MSQLIAPGPLVSVVIPVYNGERYLGEAIESVLAQDYQPFEVIVVDDGSEDGTGCVAARYAGVRFIRQPNRGPAAARNAGILAGRGEFIAFLDHDDAWTRDALELHIGYLLAHPDAGCTICTGRSFLEGGTTRPAWIRQQDLEQGHPLMGSLVVRRSVFARVGLYDPGFRSSEDFDWLARARTAGVAAVVLSRPVVRRRIHAGNASHEMALSHRELLRSVRALTLQKRAARPDPPTAADGTG